jgi:maltose O-acetyltransferase
MKISKTLFTIQTYLAQRLRGDTPTKTLIKMGMRVGKNFQRQEGCNIDYSHCWLISIGDNVTLAPRVQILAHDASTKMYLNYTKIGLVEIGNNVFVGAGSIILPNVKIGNNVIIGAGTIVSTNIPDNSVAVGNPARIISNTDSYIRKHKKLMKTKPVYNDAWTLRNDIPPDKKDQMVKALKEKIGYII